MAQLNNKLSIIIPCLNEEFNIFPLSRAIIKVLDEMDISAEIIFVNDGSTDKTEEEILKLQKWTYLLSIFYKS